MIKIDSTGKLLWQRSLGGSGFDGAYSVKQTADGGFILLGDTQSNDGDVTSNHDNSGSTNDFWVVKLDSNGKLIWQKTLGGSSDDYAQCIHQTSDGGFIAVGSTQSPDGDVTGFHDHEDFWIVKLGYAGQNGVASELRVQRSINYPNPFADKTTIVFGEPVHSASTLMIYNMLGEEIRKISVPVGISQITIERKGLASGTYIYRLMDKATTVASGNIVVE